MLYFFVLKPFVKVLKWGLFIGFPPSNMPLCSAVYVAKIPSLFFISSPLGTSLQIVLVLEPAPCRTFRINNHKGILNPSNKFRTGIPFFSVLQEGLGSLKQLKAILDQSPFPKLYHHPIYVPNSCFLTQPFLVAAL